MEKIKETNSELQLSDNIILTIKEGNVNKKALRILSILSLLSILIPVVMLVYLTQSSEGLQFGFIISITVFILAFGYFMRLYLWNKYGQEVFIINKNEFMLFYDYGYFKDYQHQCHYGVINILVQHNGKLKKMTPKLFNNIRSEESFYIVFFVDDKIIESKALVNIQTIWRMTQYLDKMSSLQNFSYKSK